MTGKVAYHHDGITLQPIHREETELLTDEQGRIVGSRKEIYPWG